MNNKTGREILSTVIVALALSSSIVNAQVNFEGCTTFENARANLLLKSTVNCLGTTAYDTLTFLESVSDEDIAKIRNCFDNPTVAMDDCKYVTNWLGTEASEEGTVPHAIVDAILEDPVGTCSCLSSLPDSTNARSLSPQCDAYRIVDSLKSLNGVCGQATMAEDWLNSEWTEGCDSADLVKLTMSALPMSQCLGLKADDLKKLEENVDRKILSDVKSCVYNPQDSNTDCDALLNEIEEKGAQKDSVMSRVLESVVEDPEGFCQCTIGLGYNEFALSVRDQCKMKELVEYAQGADEVCALVKANEKTIQSELEGCNEADVVRAQLTGISLLGCMEIDPKEGDAIISTITGVDIEKLTDISRCYQTESTTSKMCQKELKSLARHAAMQGDVLTATLATELLEDPARMCQCVRSSTNSDIWTDMSETCSPNALYNMVDTIDTTCMNIESKIEPGDTTTVFMSGIAYDTALEQELKRLEQERIEIEMMYARDIEYDTCIGFLVAKCSEADDLRTCADRMNFVGEINKKCLRFVESLMDVEAQQCAEEKNSICPDDIFSEFGAKASSKHYKCISKSLKEEKNKECLKKLRPIKRDIHCYMEIVDKCGKYENFERHTKCIEKNMLKFSCDCAELFVGKRDQCATTMSSGREKKNRSTKSSRSVFEY